MDSNFTSTAELVRRDVEGILLRVGLLCRVFGRGKNRQSLDLKLSKESGKYTVNGRHIQDAIGIRVALYFSEDIEIVQQLLTSKFSLDVRSSTIDLPSTDQFTVARHNLIFQIPTDYLTDMQRAIGHMPIDTTFELQLRSILSEGWHEVDHDLRYKSKENWIGQDDLSRALNGIMATLETSEWSMRKIFDDLAYRQYKNRNWAAMIHCKVRMRASPQLSQHLSNLMDDDGEFAKEILQINRKRVIHCIAHLPFKIPISLDNVVYVWNHIGPKNSLVHDVTPELILQALEETVTR
jgi:ppGpp synthetase/RelA/SpoT-type nucleotidyltranferase